jgi:putative transposase
VGVDLGIHSLAVVSDGTVYRNPNALRAAQRKLCRLQRAVSRKRKGSANRKKAARKVGKLHYRIACIRRNAIHQATSAITKRHGVVVVEDLNVKGMVKNRYLAQAVSDAGFHEFRRQLGYKLAWTGGRLVVASRWFPSSKTCGGCGVVRESLKLSERMFQCPDCGFTLDRDLNAARNLAIVAGKAPETQNACGGGVSVASATVTSGEAGTRPRFGQSESLVWRLETENVSDV